MLWVQVAGFSEGGYEVSGCIKYRKFLSSWGTVSFSGRSVLHGVIHLFNISPWFQYSGMRNHVEW